MSCLLLVFIHAIIFRPAVYNHPEQLDALPVIPGRAKTAGALSLILWTAILCNGRLIGYYEPPQQKGHPGRAVVQVETPQAAARSLLRNFRP